jgi:hypothetical protein
MGRSKNKFDRTGRVADAVVGFLPVYDGIGYSAVACSPRRRSMASAKV